MEDRLENGNLREYNHEFCQWEYFIILMAVKLISL